MSITVQTRRNPAVSSLPERPIFASEAFGLSPFGDRISQLSQIPPSRMFLVRRSLESYIERNPGVAVYDASQGDGGASLPGVPQELLLRAAELQVARGTAYDTPIGSPDFRRALVEKYWQLDANLGITPENVVATVGGRDGLTKVYQAIFALGSGQFGDAILVSRVPWISYTWGPAAVGANALLAPGDDESGWVLTPEAIQESVRFAGANGYSIDGLVITSPDNPTGRYLPAETQALLARTALEAGIGYVIFDWVYHHVSDQGPMDLSLFLQYFEPAERARLIFLDALTKSLGGSNIRCGHLVASKEIVNFINAQASHSVIPGYYPQAVMLAALEIGFSRAIQPIVSPTNQSRALLRSALSEEGFRFIMDQGYYAFIDAGEWLDTAGWVDSEPLGQYLADQFGLGIVPGVFFSPYGGRWIRFSYAADPEYTRMAGRRLKDGLDSLL